MKNEEWVKIEDYNWRYEISNKGRVRSWVNNRNNKRKEPLIMKRHIINNYYHAGLHDGNGNFSQLKISRLVAKSFIPNPKNKPQVNHIDGDKLNDSVENLEWTTASENIQHAIDNGLIQYDYMNGENNYRAKLNRDDVLDIRNAYRLGCFTQKEIAKAYHLPQSSISRIVNNKRWSHL